LPTFLINIFFDFFPTFFRNVGFVNYFLSTFCKMLQHFSEMLDYFLKKVKLPAARVGEGGRLWASARGRGGRPRRRDPLRRPTARYGRPQRSLSARLRAGASELGPASMAGSTKGTRPPTPAAHADAAGAHKQKRVGSRGGGGALEVGGVDDGGLWLLLLDCCWASNGL
jgi:hypothetical protein